MCWIICSLLIIWSVYFICTADLLVRFNLAGIDVISISCLWRRCMGDYLVSCVLHLDSDRAVCNVFTCFVLRKQYTEMYYTFSICCHEHVCICTIVLLQVKVNSDLVFSPVILLKGSTLFLCFSFLFLLGDLKSCMFNLNTMFILNFKQTSPVGVQTSDCIFIEFNCCSDLSWT